MARAVISNPLLTLVGTGYALAGQFTAESIACIEKADKLFYLIPDPVTEVWVRELNPTAESLHSSYAVGRDRSITYEAMVERILAPLRANLNVCAVFYGHPGVLCEPGHEAVRRALDNEKPFAEKMGLDRSFT